MNFTELLNPQNSALILIDFQPQMTFGVANIDRQTLFNNVILLAKAAKIFNVPTILTTVESKSFSGDMCHAGAGENSQALAETPLVRG
ncbi:MAG: hypothetical protein FD174_3319 [Geobacteraceae bacterium]|nr:MAG: hypothetical protein FD174_3319 [Geobacteraceae bacterium]